VALVNCACDLGLIYECCPLFVPSALDSLLLVFLITAFPTGLAYSLANTLLLLGFDQTLMRVSVIDNTSTIRSVNKMGYYICRPYSLPHG